MAPSPREATSDAAGANWDSAYRVSDAAARSTGSTPVVEIGDGKSLGIVAGGRRLIVDGEQFRVAPALAESPLKGVAARPHAHGGGFYFFTDRAVFASAAFDGELVPLFAVEGSIVDVRAVPGAVWVDGMGGRRWIVDLANHALVPAEPLGVVDVRLLDDGRGLALGEFGRAYVTTTGGRSWRDVTETLSKPPEHLGSTKDSLWFGARDRVLSLSPAGKLEQLVRAPIANAVRLRTDPAGWHGPRSPLELALSTGTVGADGLAVLVFRAITYHVSLSSGEVVRQEPAQLPPSATCELGRGRSEVLGVCVDRNRSLSVVSMADGDVTFHVDRTFSSPSSNVSMSDDGVIVVGEPCAPSSSRTGSSACVRAPGGGWRELRVGDVGDAGATPRVAHWIPQTGGSALALLDTTPPAIFDPASGSSVDLVSDVDPNAAAHLARNLRSRGGGHLDRAASADGGGHVRAWASGSAVEIAHDGQVGRPAFDMPKVVHAGRYALSVDVDGRVWQSLDRGWSWNEVAAPPKTSPGSLGLRSCSDVGCDLGVFYRVGWAASQPSPEQVPPPVREPPVVATSELARLVCEPASAPVRKTLEPRELSPDDWGLGARRIPIDDDDKGFETIRMRLGRYVAPGAGESESAAESSPRVVQSGWAFGESDDGTLRALGPDPRIAAARRRLDAITPFDVDSRVWTSSFGLSDVRAAAHASGVVLAPLIEHDPTILFRALPLGGKFVDGVRGLAVAGDRGLVGTVLGGRARPAFAFLAHGVDHDALELLAAARIDDRTTLFAVGDESGSVQVWSVSGGKVRRVAAFTGVQAEGEPPNLDAFAVMPDGSWALLRTRSDASPPSVSAPAVLARPGQPLERLGTWDSLSLIGDPVCRGVTGAHVLVQASAPWIEVDVRALGRGGEEALDEAPAWLRLVWARDRVCLVGLEQRIDGIESADFFDDPSGEDPIGGPLAAWIVASFDGKPRAQEVVVAAGVEHRRPVTCRFVAPRAHAHSQRLGAADAGPHL